MSRLQNESTEWRLSPFVFWRILEVFCCKPEIDLFGSCMNLASMPVCLMASKQKCNSYRCIQCIMLRIEFLCISSFQPNRSSYSKSQLWFTIMVSLLKNFPILLPPNILILPSKRSAKRPLYPKMKLQRFTYQGKLRKHKASKRNYRCYRRFVKNNHPKSVRISLQAMVCLCKFKEHGSLYSRCKYSVVIHAWYVHNWLFIQWSLCSTQCIVQYSYDQRLYKAIRTVYLSLAI